MFVCLKREREKEKGRIIKHPLLSLKGREDYEMGAEREEARRKRRKEVRRGDREIMDE